MQPSHYRPPAQFRVQTICLDWHKPVVFRERRANQGHLVLRAPRARRSESLFDDQANPVAAPAGLHRLVGRSKTEGACRTERTWKVTAAEVKARAYNLDIKNPHSITEDHGDPVLLLHALKASE